MAGCLSPSQLLEGSWFPSPPSLPPYPLMLSWSQTNQHSKSWIHTTGFWFGLHCLPCPSSNRCSSALLRTLILSNLWGWRHMNSKRCWCKLRACHCGGLSLYYIVAASRKSATVCVCMYVRMCVCVCYVTFLIVMSYFFSYILAMDCTLCILTDESWTKGGLKLSGKHDVPCSFIEKLFSIKILYLYLTIWYLIITSN